MSRRSHALVLDMRWKVLALIACLMVVTENVQAQSVGPASYQPQKGEFHPDFVLPDINDGSPVRLSDHLGKKVLLVHFASW
ncbi:MAG: hypothetical protein AAFN77_15260 [Planctomycetota bacterium]